MTQQTAVEWLIDRLLDGSLRFEETKMGFLISMDNDEIEQAKAMEREQIINAYGDGQENGINCQKKLFNGDDCNIITALEYYNETYNK
jgi:hypothetical protein